MAAVPPVDRELWGEYAVGSFFILLRFFARWKVVGFRNFGPEDALMLVALISYAAITAMIHLITQHGSTIGQTPESVLLLTEEQIAGFTIGQKLTWADWMVYLVYIWSLKATLLTMFSRLVSGLPRHELFLKFVIGYTVVAFFGAAISHICVCLPVHKSWQVVPYPGDACALRNLNYYLVSFFNASSDVVIILVPMPIIFRAKIPIWRRAMLLLLLCSGAFVAVATILRAYYSLKSITLLPVASGWTSRETFVAAVVVSIPGIKPLFSQSKWFRFKSSKQSDGYYGSGGGGGGRSGQSGSHVLRTIGGGHMPAASASAEAGHQPEWRIGGKEIRGTRLSEDGSEDVILSDLSERRNSSSIHVTRDYKVSSEQTTVRIAIRDRS